MEQHIAVKYGGAFWDHIVSRYFVQYRILSIIFPHDHVVPSHYVQ